MDQMSAHEFNEWMAFCSTEPLGEDRADLRSATLVSMLANIYRKEGAALALPSDFIVDFWKPPIPEERARNDARILGSTLAAMVEAGKTNGRN